MELFNRKPKTSIEDFCRQFYDSEIFYVKTCDEDGASALWEKALNFVTEADPSLAKVDRDLFRREMTALHMELFGMAWMRYLWGEDMLWSEDKFLFLQREVVFTKSYLEKNGYLDIWETMFAYNEAIASSRRRGDAERAITDRCVDHYFIKEGIGPDCTGRIRNRMYENPPSDDLFDYLTDTVSKRLGWDIKPDSEPFLQLEALIWYLYGLAQAYADLVVIDTQRGTVKSKSWDSAKKVSLGMVCILGACLLWYLLVGNPLHELALIQRGQTVPGFVVDAWEDVEDRYGGQSHAWIHSVTYTYKLPDGREFTETADGSGRLKRGLSLPYPIEVEYLPDKPTVSRIKGTGNDSIQSWLLRNVGLGGLLLALFCSFGISIVWKGVRDLRRCRTIQKAIVLKR